MASTKAKDSRRWKNIMVGTIRNGKENSSLILLLIALSSPVLRQMLYLDSSFNLFISTVKPFGTLYSKTFLSIF